MGACHTAIHLEGGGIAHKIPYIVFAEGVDTAVDGMASIAVGCIEADGVVSCTMIVYLHGDRLVERSREDEHRELGIHGGVGSEGSNLACSAERLAEGGIGVEAVETVGGIAGDER